MLKKNIKAGFQYSFGYMCGRRLLTSQIILRHLSTINELNRCVSVQYHTPPMKLEIILQGAGVENTGPSRPSAGCNTNIKVSKE